MTCWLLFSGVEWVTASGSETTGALPLRFARGVNDCKRRRGLNDSDFEAAVLFEFDGGAEVPACKAEASADAGVPVGDVLVSAWPGLATATLDMTTAETPNDSVAPATRITHVDGLEVDLSSGMSHEYRITRPRPRILSENERRDHRA